MGRLSYLHCGGGVVFSGSVIIRRSCRRRSKKRRTIIADVQARCWPMQAETHLKATTKALRYVLYNKRVKLKIGKSHKGSLHIAISLCCNSFTITSKIVCDFFNSEMKIQNKNEQVNSSAPWIRTRLHFP